MAAPPLLTLSDISLSLGTEPLFRDLRLSIQPGDRFCLVGRNGSGKSTLMKVMAGLTEAEEGDRFLQPGRSVGYMDQHPDLSDFDSLRDFASSNLDPNEQYRADMVADGLKLDLSTNCNSASGGERRRAALVKLIAEDPDLMLLDEPTNHMDIEAIEWLEGHLAQTSKAFVLISHDRSFLRNLTRATLWVDRGQVRQRSRGFESFEAWRDEVYETEDLQAHKRARLIKEEARWAVEGISGRRKRNQGRLRRLQDLRAEHSSQIKRSGAADLNFQSGQKSGKRVIDAENVAKGFGDRHLFADFSIRIERGERIALVGPNGVGKTTLLKVLTGDITPDEGKIWFGHNIERAEFDQNRSALDPSQSLWDSLTEDKDLGISGKNDQIMVRGSPRHVVGYLKDFLFSENQARGPVSVLSGGEKARLLLARIMARDSNLLILDEPTNDLDVETLDLLQEVLDDYDGTVLLVSHDRDFLDRVATRTIALEGDGAALTYAGGWSDYRAQRGSTSKPEAKQPQKSKKKHQATKSQASEGLSFTQKHRLEALPGEIDRLEKEISKLEDYLSAPDLFQTAPVKFQKASEGLAERQTKLAQAEEEWLALAEMAEN